MGWDRMGVGMGTGWDGMGWDGLGAPVGASSVPSVPQCFDLESYLQLNCERGTWRCPVCK